MNRLCNLVFRTWAGRGALLALIAFPFLLAPGAITRALTGAPELPGVLAAPPSPLVLYAGTGFAVLSILMFITQWLVDDRRIWIVAGAGILAVAALAPVAHA